MSKLAFLIPVVVIASVACATRGSVRDLPSEEGAEMIFRGSLRATALAARNAVAATPFEIVEAGEDPVGVWYLIAWGSGATYLRATCQQVDNGLVAVRILTRDRDLDPGSRDDWSQTIFAQMALELEVAEPSRRGPGPTPRR